MTELIDVTRPLPLLGNTAALPARLEHLAPGLRLLPLRTISEIDPREAVVLVVGGDWKALHEALTLRTVGGSRLQVVALASDESEGLAAVARGASDWVLAGDRVRLAEVIRVCRARHEYRAATTPAAETGERHSQEMDLQRIVHGIRDASLRTVGLLLEKRDLETKGHTERVVAMAQRLGEHMGLGKEELRALRWGAYLHDIGKIALPDRILFKPGRLTREEYELVRSHVDTGVEMLAELPFLPDGARRLVRHHHERWNGTGYPNGLTGQEIPLLARVFGTVDVFDALCSQRPYKPAWPRARALETVRGGAGREFDPQVVEAFLDLMYPAPPPQSLRVSASVRAE